MGRRVATCAALLAFAVVLVWGQSTAAASGADTHTATTGATPAPIAATPSDAPAPGDSAAPATPTPTPTSTVPPTSDPPSSDACDEAIYTDGTGGGATAIVPGAAVVGGVVIHNRSPFSTAGGVLNVGVLPNGQPLKPGAVPTVEWDLDGGAWRHVDETFVPAMSGAAGHWASTDIPAPDIPAHGSRTFRMRIAFPLSTVPGQYSGVFALAIPDCAGAIYDDNEVAFDYDPNLPPSAQAGSTGSSRRRGRVLHVPLVPHTAPVPTTTPAVSVGSTPVGPAGAQAAAIDGTAGPASALRRNAGIGAAGLCGLLALFELIRWRRTRRD